MVNKRVALFSDGPKLGVGFSIAKFSSFQGEVTNFLDVDGHFEGCTLPGAVATGVKDSSASSSSSPSSSRVFL